MSLKILIIDRNLAFTKIARKFLLNQPGIDLVEVLNSRDKLLEKVKRIEPDLILIDKNFSDDTEGDLCHILKQEIKGVKVVSTTLFGFKYVVEENNGFDDNINKENFGIEIKQIIRSLSKHVES